jgi:hypothetical protein
MYVCMYVCNVCNVCMYVHMCRAVLDAFGQAVLQQGQQGQRRGSLKVCTCMYTYVLTNTYTFIHTYIHTFVCTRYTYICHHVLEHP